MGCWNKTCGLSNLHIYAGTPVYVFVMEEARDDSNCYTTSLFRPLLLPFESEYNDYGGGENSSGIAFELIMQALKDQLVEMPLGDNEYHDIAVSKDKFDEELFFEAVHENRLFIRDRYSQDKTAVTFTMFRKDIVDDILANRVIEDYVGNGKGTGGWGNNYVYYKFADIAASVRPLLEHLAAETQGQHEYLRGFIFDRLHKYRNQFRAASWLNNDTYRYSRLVDVRSLLGKAIELNTPEALDKAEALAIEHLKGLFIDGFMHATRKTWIPGGHEGSQSASAGAHRLLANTIIAALDREKAEWLEENEGDEEEYMEE